jgi:hypothetical protein
MPQERFASVGVAEFFRDSGFQLLCCGLDLAILPTNLLTTPVKKDNI